ncbi:MAG: hypothetical protein L6Q29_04880 [Candidatus Pacebacteria bacterium]|nr:hypothetical protein [Candidatus Paceibacterota bacterium]NUM41793.1 hypothetical protein [Leptospiraceae bacterium]
MTQGTGNDTKNRILDRYEREHKFLRDELSSLKECQIKFLTFSVTTTGLILGFFGKNYIPQNPPVLPGSHVSSGLIWLLPLVVLTSSMVDFFDKATTITRVVDYFRR